MIEPNGTLSCSFHHWASVRRVTWSLLQTSSSEIGSQLDTNWLTWTDLVSERRQKESCITYSWRRKNSVAEELPGLNSSLQLCSVAVWSTVGSHVCKTNSNNYLCNQQPFLLSVPQSLPPFNGEIHRTSKRSLLTMTFISDFYKMVWLKFYFKKSSLS